MLQTTPHHLNLKNCLLTQPTHYHDSLFCLHSSYLILTLKTNDFHYFYIQITGLNAQLAVYYRRKSQQNQAYTMDAMNYDLHQQE